MSEIDYSNFYIKFSSKSNKKPKSETKRGKKAEAIPSPPKKKKGALFSVVMILICFALTFLLAGILNKEALASVFQKGEDYFAYALVSKVEEGGEKGLNELSKFVRAGGGGGNLFLKDDSYYVVHSVYLEKEDALKVQSRDPSSEVFGLKERAFTTDNNDLKPYAERYNAEKRKAVKSLYDAVIENARTDDNDGSIKTILKLKEPFQALKDEVMTDRSLDVNQTLAYIVAIDTIMGRLEGLTTASASRISLISDMRYQLFAICTNI